MKFQLGKYNRRKTNTHDVMLVDCLFVSEGQAVFRWPNGRLVLVDANNAHEVSLYIPLPYLENK